MARYRKERLKSQLLREISDIVRREIDLPENIFITVKRVELSKDGSQADVFISGLRKEDVVLAVDRLNRAAGYVQHLLGKRLRIRTVPRPKFLIDPEVEL